ncbi:MAG TPA: CHAD domain-containing protein [Propionibacteriaceae bacterium]|nr:CHAD domain-containing protein [Propionibacteriaceae bacterium]
MSRREAVPTSREVVGPYVAQCAATIRTSLPLVLADEPDAIHAARVATRRLRSALRTFRPLWTHGYSSLRDELRWYAGLLSRPRDLEVVGDWLASLLSGPEAAALYGEGVAAEVTERVRLDREEALATMRTELEGDRFSELVHALPPVDWSPAADVPADLLVAGLAAVPGQKALEEAMSLPHGEDRPAALHELRKTTKEARYAVDALGPGAEQQAALWKKVTGTLGVAQDGQVAQGVLKELAKDAPAHRAVWDALSAMVAQEAAVAESEGLALVAQTAELRPARVSLR